MFRTRTFPACLGGVWASDDGGVSSFVVMNFSTAISVIIIIFESFAAVSFSLDS